MLTNAHLDQQFDPGQEPECIRPLGLHPISKAPPDYFGKHINLWASYKQKQTYIEILKVK